MARKSRTAVLKRQREVRKAEKAAQKREKREAREQTPADARVATADDLAGYGVGGEASPDDEDSGSPPPGRVRVSRVSGAPTARRAAARSGPPASPARRFRKGAPLG